MNKNSKKEDKTYTIDELAEEMQVSTKKLREWTKQGELPAMKAGKYGRLHYSWQAVQKFLEQHTINRRSQP